MTIDQSFLYKKNRLQQIKGFYYAARFGSISRAAKVMNLTQSTVTLQIQSLERDLNLKLLKRGFKSISLTKDGEEFYKMACPLMQEFEYVVEKFLKSRNQEDQLKIDIAVHHAAISFFMPKVIAVFKKKYPKGKIMLRNISASQAVERLKDNNIDLAFYPNIHLHQEIKFIEGPSYDPILIMNKNNPLVKKQIKNPKDLKAFDLIRIDQGLITLPLFEDIVRDHGIKGSVEFENGNWEMLKHLVKEGNFVAVVSELCIEKNDDDLVIKNLKNFFPTMNYSIMHKKGNLLKPIIKEFVEIMLNTK